MFPVRDISNYLKHRILLVDKVHFVRFFIFHHDAVTVFSLTEDLMIVDVGGVGYQLTEGCCICRGSWLSTDGGLLYMSGSWLSTDGGLLYM